MYPLILKARMSHFCSLHTIKRGVVKEEGDELRVLDEEK